jgi:hypothetical protein
MRLERLIKLLRMQGSVGERIGTGFVIVAGFIIGLYVGRVILGLI